ncbi:MAG: TonB-dependent receptor [Proteobacteria bacterium]|nr:TonB-dependent receptor [Pseudomonadota bacterium]
MLRTTVIACLPAMTLVMASAEGATAAEDSSSEGLAEIVVTANKIAEPLNRVAESIGVLTADAIARTGTQDLQGVINHVPGLSADFDGAPGTGFVSVRGISPSGGNSTTTGFYIDDVSINFGNFGFAGAFEPALFDLERVEVLRGPQGTLYGAESFGGTIRFVTRQPNLNSAEGTATVNGYGQNASAPGGGGNVAYGMPIIPGVLAARVAATYQYDGGFVNHVGTDGNLTLRNTNAQAVAAVRGTLLWQPTDNLRITPEVQYQLSKNDDTWTFDGGQRDFRTPRDIREPLRDEFTMGAINAVYTFGRHELTSVSSYVDRRIVRIQDYTIYDMGYIGPVVAQFYDPNNTTDAAQVLPNLATAAHHLNANRQWGQEIRLVSHFDEIGLQTLVGFYYNHEARTHTSHEDAVGFGAYTMSHFGVSANEALDASFGLPPGTSDLGDTVYGDNTLLTFNRRAVYGEASWSPTKLPGLKVTAGVRYSRISDSDVGFQDGYFNNGYAPRNQSFAESQAAPKYRIAYQLSESQLYYISAAKGFRLGGPNNALPTSCIPEEQQTGVFPGDSYRTDSIWSYELGTKLGLLDRKVQLNMAAFHISWTDIAQSINFDRCGFGFTANVGTATSNGGDISLQMRPWTGFDANVGLAYTQAKFLQSVPLKKVNRNDPIPYSPEWTASLEMGQEWKVASGAVYMRANSSYTDVSKQNLDVTGIQYSRPSYLTVGLNLGYRFTTGTDVSLFIRNLTNAEPFLDKNTGLGYDEVFSLRPRQIGLQASTTF